MKNEVVQHAKAFKHMMQKFAVEKKPLSQELIKETHKILTTGVPIIEPGRARVPPSDYGGMYRTMVVGAGTTNFLVPRFIPTKMKEMCDNLMQELDTAETTQHGVDPFSLAAKYSLEFVSIHPFQDGNGRMCRIVLNAILLRIAGLVIFFGESEEEREEYMAIKRRSSEEMEGHGEYATFVLERAASCFREIQQDLSKDEK